MAKEVSCIKIGLKGIKIRIVLLFGVIVEKNIIS